jgi:putative transposase
MPNPQAEVITLSENQQKILTALARRRTNPHQLVRRAQLILQASAGKNNSQISRQLQLHRHQVRLWRKRWQQAQESLKQAETEGEETFLEQRICEVLSDEFRSGTPATFSIEQIVEIIAIACEDPRESGYPISHWTPKEIAKEALKRGIVAEISPRSVGRFLKGSYSTASSSSLLAQRATR